MKKLIRILILIFLLGTCVLALFFTVRSYKILSILQDKTVKNSFVHTVDEFDENFDTIRNRETIVNDLIDINQKFHASENFDFIELALSTIYPNKSDFKGTSQFSYSESDFNYKKHQARIKAVFMGENVPQYFNIALSEGKFFSSSDYIFLDKIEMPVLLGDKYKDIYKLNDTIDLVVQGLKKQGRVIGFLTADSNLSYFNQPIDLSTYVVVPYEKIDSVSNNLDKKEHQFRMMLDKNNGVIAPKSNAKVINEEINSICKSKNLPPYILSSSYQESINDAKFKLTICVAIFIVSGTGFVWLFIKQYKNYKKRKIK